MIMNIRVLTPQGLICDTITEEVILPGVKGEIGILEGHVTFMTALETGLLRIKFEKKWIPIILGEGLAEIDNNLITILANDIEELTNLKLDEATKQLEEAKVALETLTNNDGRIKALNNLKKAIARVEGLNYLSKNTK